MPLSKEHITCIWVDVKSTMIYLCNYIVHVFMVMLQSSFISPALIQSESGVIFLHGRSLPTGPGAADPPPLL